MLTKGRAGKEGVQRQDCWCFHVVLPCIGLVGAACCLITAWVPELLHQGIDEGQAAIGPVPEDHLPACLCKAMQRLQSQSMVCMSCCEAQLEYLG